MRSSQQKMLQWVRAALFVGEDAQARCAEGIKWLSKEVVDAYEQASESYANAYYQYERRIAVEKLLGDVVEGKAGAAEKARVYLGEQEFQFKKEKT